LPLLPDQLRSHGGYNTYLVGKWHNGPETLKDAFPDGKSILLGGMANHASMMVQDIKGGELREKYKAESFSSTTFADAAIDYIRGYESDDPFFLYVAFTAPHDPRNPPVEYRDYYYNHRPPLPENFLPYHPFKNAPMRTQERDECLAPWPRTEEVISDQLCAYYGLITHLDEQVGRIVKALNSSPHATNTMIIYTADHGLAMGSHGLLGKQNIYEQSMKSPLIICGPGIPRGQTRDAFTYIHDLYSTICDFAEIDIPENIDSKSLLQIINSDSKEIRNSLFLPFQNNQRAINDGRKCMRVI
jgi:arylsulfatase A-like enzyme